MKIIAGLVYANKDSGQGVGFTYVSGDFGRFTIKFNEAFNKIYSVTATVSIEVRAGDYPNTLHNAVILDATNSHTNVKVGDRAGNGDYRNFYFIAVGE